MDGEWSPIAFDPIAGVNSEDSDTAIANSELQNSQNFLFERKFTLTRPGLKAITLTGTPLNDFVLDAYSLYAGGSPFNLAYTHGGGGGSFIYKFDTSAFTQLTPGALGNFANSFFFKPISVNGVVLIGNQTAGIQRWVTSGTTLTSITTAKPLYMTGHFSRAIGAYDQVGTTGPITVEWSKAGDETTWNTSPSVDGSGLALLTEIPDAITGLENLHNVIVVMRTLGITLGYSTGVAIPAFRFETYTKDYGGSPYPRTLATYNNILYYVGRDNVYSFDLRNITPIGYKIRTKLFASLTLGSAWTQYRGFITTSQRSGELRARYHLFPNFGSSGPHFTYDILDGTWAIHNYSVSSGVALNYLESAAPTLKEGPAFLDFNVASPKIEAWDNTVNCETASFMISKTFRMPKYDRDMKIERVLMSYKDQGATSSPITVTSTGRIGRNIESQADSQTPGLNNDQHWVRAWWNTRMAAGQDIQVRVDIPAGVQFQTDHIEVAVAELGGLREI